MTSNYKFINSHEAKKQSKLNIVCGRKMCGRCCNAVNSTSNGPGFKSQAEQQPSVKKSKLFVLASASIGNILQQNVSHIPLDLLDET